MPSLCRPSTNGSDNGIVRDGVELRKVYILSGVCHFYEYLTVAIDFGKTQWGLHNIVRVFVGTRAFSNTHTHTTQNQYILVHDAILESVTCGDTQIETFSLRVAMRKLKERSIQGETGFQQQFSVSCSTTKPTHLRAFLLGVIV